MPIPIPASLVRHLKERRCVLFVGAGLSAAAGLPGWQKLVLSMVEELDSEGVTDGSTTELRTLVGSGKLLEVADHCRQRLGERRYQEFLGDQLRGGSGDLAEVHSLVTRLPFRAVVTTNYDKLLERAYSKFRGDLPKVVTCRDRETLGSLLFSGGFFILKAHGDIDDAGSLVLTARDYREIIHANAAFDGLFSALLMTRSLLIIAIAKAAVARFELSADVLAFDTTNFDTFIATTHARGVGSAVDMPRASERSCASWAWACWSSETGHVPLLYRTYAGNGSDQAVLSACLGGLAQLHEALDSAQARQPSTQRTVWCAMGGSGARNSSFDWARRATAASSRCRWGTVALSRRCKWPHKAGR